MTADIDAPSEVESVLRESCDDCHSNETRWPWYSRVAPVSWLIARDVHEAREHLNFSDWGNPSTRKRTENMEEVWEEVEERERPLWLYLPMHPEARITAAERTTLERWFDRRHSGDSSSRWE